MTITGVIVAAFFVISYYFVAGYQLKNRVKSNLAAGKSSYGAFIALFDPAVTEIFGASGLDYIFIDGEHSQMTPAVLLGHLRAAGASGIVPLVRVPGPTDVDSIKPWVDAGPLGIVVPNIYGVKDAQAAVNALKYKTAKYPNGTRRVGIGRATMYSEFIEDYLDEANDEVLVVLMAERIEFIDVIDEVLSQVKGIDALSLGPQDLAASMGYLGQPNATEVVEAINRLEDACVKYGVALGGSVPDRATAEKLEARGWRLFTGPADVQVLIEASNAFARSVMN